MKLTTPLLVFCFFLCLNFTLYGQIRKHPKTDSLIQVANKLTIIAPEDCIKLLDSIKLLNKTVKDPVLQAKINNVYGCAYNSMSVYDKSFDHFHKGLEFKNEIKNHTVIASLNNNLGMLYDNFLLDKEALEYFEAAEAIYLKNPQLDEAKNYSFILLNIALTKNYQKKYNEALEHIKKAKEYVVDATTISPKYRKELLAITEIEMANTLSKMDQLDKAQSLATENIEILENSRQFFALAHGYFYLANIFYFKKNIDNSYQYLKKADSLEKIIGHKPLQKDIDKLFSKIYKKRGDFENSLVHLQSTIDIDKELFSSKETWAFYAMRQDAIRKQEAQKKMISAKNKELQELIILLYATGVTSLLVIGGLFIYNKRIKYKKEKTFIEQQKKITKIELEKTREVLDLKKRELISSALQIIQNGKTVKSFKKQLEQLKREVDPKFGVKIASISNSLKYNPTRDWTRFKGRFEQVNMSFFKKIQKQYPSLTPNELKLCAFLKLSFNTKDIANLIGISSESVKVSRYKIRKKMNLKRNENLVTHINKF